MSSQGTTGNTRVQSPLSVTTATGVSPGLTILLSIWRDISKQNKTKFKTNKQTKVTNNKNKTPRRPELPLQQPTTEGNAARQRAGLQAGSTASQKKVLTYKPLCTYVYTHTYTHPSHTNPHTYPLSCTPRYLKYIRLFLMPCPSQMVGDEEEGSQANSASTGCWLQHYWITSCCCQWKNKANGCLHGGRQSERLT